MLYRSTDRLCRAGAPVHYLAHSASFQAGEKSAPSNSGIKHLAGCELSELFTRAAAAAVAAATRALARISRPRSELTRLSSAFFSVGGIRTPITLVDAREDFC